MCVLLKNLRSEITKKKPVWIMRQAGRYLPEYREIRKTSSDFMNFCKNPNLAYEATMQPIRRYGFDGAIIFSDILVIPEALKQKVWFDNGPKLSPFDEKLFTKSVDNFSDLIDDLKYVFDVIDLVRRDLNENYKETTLLGFSGMPWTLLCYMLEGKKGGPLGEFKNILEMHRINENKLYSLILSLCDVISMYLCKKIEHGCDAVQLFESWGGIIPNEFVNRYSIDIAEIIIKKIHEKHPNVPVIYYGRGLSKHYSSIKFSRPFALGVDESADIVSVFNEVSTDIPIQGNIHPETLIKGGKDLELEVKQIMDISKNRPSVINLGHGIRKETPTERVDEMLKYIRLYS